MRDWKKSYTYIHILVHHCFAGCSDKSDDTCRGDVSPPGISSSVETFGVKKLIRRVKNVCSIAD